jgi:DNA-binding NarL/FixJ family response regulator
VDLTPFLAQLRADHALVASQLQGQRLMLCLGSPLLVSAVVGAMPDPERIVAAATSATAALPLVARHRPHLLLLSDRLSQGCGVDVAQEVKRLHPATRVVLVISGTPERSRVASAIAAGCEAVLRADALGTGGELMAIRTICSGGVVIDRELETECRQARARTSLLSSRESQVLQRVLHGDSNQEIARHLFLSVDTVKSHVSRAVQKLQARDRTHAAVKGLQLGLLEWP